MPKLASLTAAQQILVNKMQPDDGLQMGPRIAGIEEVGWWHRQKWVNPITATTTSIFAATACPAAGTTTVSGASLLTQPDLPRCITLTVALGAGSLAGNAVITGTNIEGAVISETIALTTATLYTSLNAFATVTSVVLPTRTTAGDTVACGVAAALGLDRRLNRNTVNFAVVGTTKETTAPTVVVDPTSISLNTISFNTAPNAARTFYAYMIDEPN
jgi:hypothetical protein